MKQRTHIYYLVFILGITFSTSGLNAASDIAGTPHRFASVFSNTADRNNNAVLDARDIVSPEKTKPVNLTSTIQICSYSDSNREDIFLFGHGSALSENSCKRNTGLRTILKI